MEHTTCSSSGDTLKDTNFGYTLSVIGGKYKMTVMYWLFEHKPAMRYNELKRQIGTISFKTLTNTLRELERDELVSRTEYPQVPPKVEYRLSEKGETLMPILNMMCDWGEENRAATKHLNKKGE